MSSEATLSCSYAFWKQQASKPGNKDDKNWIKNNKGTRIIIFIQQALQIYACNVGVMNEEFRFEQKISHSIKNELCTEMC